MESSRVRKVNPVLGQNQHEFFSAVMEGCCDNIGFERNRYLNYFRPPPTHNGVPLMGDVSLKSPTLQIQSDKTLVIRTNFVREYFDSRLEFDPRHVPSGKKFVEFPPEFYSCRVWAPVVTVNNVDEASVDTQSSFPLESERRPQKILVTPEGHVYNSQPSVFRLRPVNLAQKGEEEPLEYRLVLSEDKETVESLLLQWKNPKVFVDCVESLKELRTPEGEKIHRVESVSVDCVGGKTRREELGGEFGDLTFSQLEMTIRLKLHKDDEAKPEA